MRTNSTRAKAAPGWQPLKLLLWTALASLLFGLIRFGEVAEDQLRVARNYLHPTKASGEIVFVGIDDASIRAIGEWPWPRAKHARLVDEATRLGAKMIVMDTNHEAATDPGNDQALSAALKRSGRVVMAARERSGTHEGKAMDGLPMRMFLEHARPGLISVFYNYQSAVWKVPYGAVVGGRSVQSVAAIMAGRPVPSVGEFKLDYSIDPDTIPYMVAKRLYAGKVGRAEIVGKTVIIGPDTERLGDSLWFPGSGRKPGALVQIIGAETLKRGDPANLGFLPAWLLAIIACALVLTRTRGTLTASVLAGMIGALLFVPAFLEAKLVFLDVTPGLFALLIVSSRLGWLRWQAGALVNPATGLPNMAAFRLDPAANKQAIVVARIRNYAEIASTLESSDEVGLVNQVVQRLSVTGGAGNRIYQGDEGIFAWLADPGDPLANHLEALHSLFRSPVKFGGKPIDLALTFGVEMGSARPVANRLGSALVAADEAWNDGLKWKYHDPAREEEVSWRVSLLGQLDAAIDQGEVWVAYQPQFDLQRQRIVGAEALARWTHPEKGPISPAEFVAAAEQNGRIGKLTDFVLDRSIAAAAAINRRGVEFTIAVNISARMLTDHDLIDRVGRLLQAHGLRPERLTLELTETEALHGADNGITVLEALRASGVRIAIDDYGTGLSTLEYLRKIPANEIKIDQSFIKAMKVNRSDLIMVQSTIALAHSLDRTVVAEGVEDPATLDQLAQMQCDVAQGYAIGRPMGVRELVQRLQERSIRRVA